jgi:hypothetical protein
MTNPASDQSNNVSPFGAQIKCYGQQGALCVEETFLKENQDTISTVNLELAPRQGETVDWVRKINFQLSVRELPELCAVMLGFLPDCEFKRKEKGLIFKRQTDKIFVRATQGRNSLALLPLGIGDSYRVSAFLLNALKKQTHQDDGQLMLAALRGSAALHQIPQTV